jgi:hypothetical protein
MDHHEKCWIQGACSSDQRNVCTTVQVKISGTQISHNSNDQ